MIKDGITKSPRTNSCAFTEQENNTKKNEIKIT